jgi:hypothetical protein
MSRLGFAGVVAAALLCAPCLVAVAGVLGVMAVLSAVGGWLGGNVLFAIGAGLAGFAGGAMFLIRRQTANDCESVEGSKA